MLECFLIVTLLLLHRADIVEYFGIISTLNPVMLLQKRKRFLVLGQGLARHPLLIVDNPNIDNSSDVFHVLFSKQLLSYFQAFLEEFDGLWVLRDVLMGEA